MYSFALMPEAALCVEDRLGRGIRLEPPPLPTPDGVQYLPWRV
jgi:hypothetical protein